jgi:hypothetical protein
MRLPLSELRRARAASLGWNLAHGRRSLAVARGQLGQAVGEAVSGSLAALGERLGLHAQGAENTERLRDVVARDRALAAASPGGRAKPERSAASGSTAQESGVDASQAGSAPVVQEPVSTPEAASAPAPPPRAAEWTPVGGEPIRTRTMARLLAAQGYRERALALYAELLLRDPEDAGLREEAERLGGLRASAPGQP